MAAARHQTKRAVPQTTRSLARPLVLVATKRPLLLEGIRAVLGRSPRLVVEPLELDPESAQLPAVRDAAALVLDVEPVPVLALRLCQELRARRPALPILALVCCPHGPAEWHMRALRATGVTSLLSLDQTTPQLLTAIEALLRGDSAIAASLTPVQAAAFGQQRDPRKTRLGAHGEERPVTDRDAKLLHLVKEGLSDAAIGKQLILSPSTVKSEIATWCQRAGVKGRIQLAVWAEHHGF